MSSIVTFAANIALLTASIFLTIYAWVFVGREFGGDFSGILAGLLGAFFVYPLLAYWLFGW